MPLTDEQRNVAASVLDLLKGDAGQRALAAANLGWQPAREAAGSSWMAPHLAQLFTDPYSGRATHSAPLAADVARF